MFVKFLFQIILHNIHSPYWNIDITYCLLHTSPHSAIIFHSLPCSKWNSYPLMQDCWPMLWFWPSMNIWHLEYWGLELIGFKVVGGGNRLWLFKTSDSLENLSWWIGETVVSGGSHNDLVALSGGCCKSDGENIGNINLKYFN